MKTAIQKMNSYILSVILVCLMLPLSAAASYEIPGICSVIVNDNSACVVKTLDYSYANNAYFSLRDMAMAFNNTEKPFSLEITKNAVSLNIGNVYAPVGVENVPWEDRNDPDLTLRRNEFKVNGQKVSYYTLIMALPSGHYDCFMMAADLAMILDVDVLVPNSDSLYFDTRSPFCVSPTVLEQDGYFYGVNGVLVGDATTGEIYYQYQSDISYPIASTSKLMTCLLAMDAIAAGRITREQPVMISQAAQALAESDDGVIPLKAGEQITVNDLLLGALLPSSNECALCLAELIAGSEEAFVQMMNQKALELGLSQAVFFNSNGLPCYTKNPIPSKRQNRMSAADMFRLASYFLKVYPQVKEITSLQTATLQYLNMEVRNTNPMLLNLSETTGLKTGTTNKSGACLVTSLSANDGAIEHDLVVVVLGTEDSIERGRVSGMLARYALQTFRTGMAQSEPGTVPENLPTHAEAAVDWILQTAKKQ